MMSWRMIRGGDFELDDRETILDEVYTRVGG